MEKNKMKIVSMGKEYVSPFLRVHEIRHSVPICASNMESDGTQNYHVSDTDDWFTD